MSQNEREPTARPCTIQALIQCMVIKMSKYSAALCYTDRKGRYTPSTGNDHVLDIF